MTDVLDQLYAYEPETGLVVPVAQLTRLELLALWAVGARLVHPHEAERLDRERERRDLERGLEETGRWN